MQQKDYKEIARIIKANNLKRANVVFELADYFEREDKKDYWKTHNPKYDVFVRNKFNREQFLKDCGIEK